MKEIISHFRAQMFGKPSIKDSDLVDVFLTTFKGGRVGTLFRMTYEDAKKFIAQPKTKGKRFADEWMYLIDAADDTEPFMKDDGRFDEIIADLGIEVAKRCVSGVGKTI